MAIRKISELPQLEINYIENELTSKLEKSLIEVSYAISANEPYKFVSRNLTFGQMKNFIVYNIIGNETYNPTVDFYSIPTFKKEVNFNDDVTINNVQTQISSDKLIVLRSDIETMIVGSNKTTIQGAEIDINFDNGIIINKKNNNDTDTDTYTDKYIELTNDKITFFKSTEFGQPALFSGDLTCTGTATFDNDIIGTALHAKWSDLAELYDSDFNYEPGTLVKFGGEKEITIADNCVNAVVTTQPGFILGENDTNTKIAIALVGRVPVKVMGSINKFDKIILSKTPGVAIKRSNDQLDMDVVGIALQTIESKHSDEINLVECVVQLKM